MPLHIKSHKEPCAWSPQRCVFSFRQNCS